MRFSRATTFLVPFIAFKRVQASGQQVVATWTDTTYDVVIAVPNSSVTMNVRRVTIDNVTLATATSLNIKAGDRDSSERVRSGSNRQHPASKAGTLSS